MVELPPVSISVLADDTDLRLDQLLVKHLAGISRTTAQRWIENGRVTLNGSACTHPRKKSPLGATVTVHPEPAPPSSATPEDVPLNILFEDDHVLVLVKPAGLVVHPAAGHASGTLVNGLLFHNKLSHPDTEPNARPGIVHRLDKDTSGVMVIAKTPAAREHLVAQFQAHTIDRAYLAIVEGLLTDKTTFDTLHGRHPTDRKRFSTKVIRGKRAVTHVVPLELLGRFTLVRCTLETGRTHQIRMHLAEHGHPVLGDALYGHTSKIIPRQALHAQLLGFTHPVTSERLRFTAPPPDDFTSALLTLRHNG